MMCFLLLAALLEQAEQLHARLDQRPLQGGTAAERVSEILRRACHALERDPRVTAAMVTAMFSTEPDANAIKQAVQWHLHCIIASAAAGDQGHRDIDAVVDVLGHVWLAAMAFWAGGVSDEITMSARLETAAHLLLD